MSTNIEWTNETWNPVTGCTRISAGCKNCYAERMARRLAGRYGYLPWPYEFDVTFHEDKLYQPLSWKKPRMIFVCSMGDLFHEDVKEETILQIFDVIRKTKQHTYQILTKRPERMKWIVKQYSDYGATNFNKMMPHVWLGVTAESQQAADERIPWLLKTPAAIRFVSVEPMLEKIDLTGSLNGFPDRDKNGEWYQTYPALDWIICGGETGHGAREMKYEWAQELYVQCKAAGVAFFFKKFGDAYTGNLWSKLSLVAATREYPKGVGDV